MPTTPTGQARTFAPDELIVSKTDPKGRITYANDVFLRVSGYELDEVIGQPHNIIRHPEMPRAVFRLLWRQLAAGQEVFAFINNLAKNGDHYWVLAHVTRRTTAQAGCWATTRTAACRAASVLPAPWRPTVRFWPRSGATRGRPTRPRPRCACWKRAWPSRARRTTNSCGASSTSAERRHDHGY